jgi:succinoglycan biosynthesis protein ExoA
MIATHSNHSTSTTPSGVTSDGPTVGSLFISVIVPVRNEAAFIGDTLRQLLEQNYDPTSFEILVVDGQSNDGTQAIVSRMASQHGHVRLLDNPQRLSSAARNLGIRNSRGDVILVVDGHCEIPSSSVLRSVSDAFLESNADCLGRPQPLSVQNGTALQRAIAAARASRLGHHPESFIYSDQPQFVPAKSVAVAYRRSLFDEVGYFDEEFDAHEDGEFNYRCDAAGLKCYFTPDIAVNYFPRSTLRGLFWQIVRYGRGRVKFSRKHPGTWGIGVFIPAAFVLFMVLGAILAVCIPALRIPYVVGWGFYLLAVFWESIHLSWQERNSCLLGLAPLVFITVHLGAGVGIIGELIRGLRRGS